MFEGKHIHFSPVDQKPLCSFSTKLCRQRRLNGFAFCIRHILEDPSAPFQVCAFVAPAGQNKCTNVISIEHPKGLCNTHLQLAGFPAAKRERRLQKRENGMNQASSPKNQSNEPTSSSMEMSDGDPYNFSDDMDPKPDSIYQKPSDMSSPPHNSPLAIEPLTPSSTSCSSVDTEICKNPYAVMKLKPNNIKFKLKKKKLTVALKASLPAVLQRLGESLNGSKTQFILPKVIEDSDDDEPSGYLSTIPLKSTMPRALKLERSKKELRQRYLQLAQRIDAEEKFQGMHETAGNILAAARRYPNETGLLLQGRNPINNSSNLKIFTRRRCSFRRNNSEDCPELCLPCSTLCNRHILYSVDQQLFEFCSARGPSGPCGAPVLAINSGLPYCPAHINQGSSISESTPELVNGNNQPGLNKSNRRKARSRSTSSLGRHARRLRNRRRAKRIGGETRIHCIEAADNGMELDVETVDSPENCSPAYPTPAQLIPNPVVPSVDNEVEILEDHDLKELLNRLPDETFQEIFAMTQVAASSSRNGLFVPSREEAEELERALEGVPMDKFASINGESDLSDLSLIDDHALALAHDLMALSSGTAAQSMLMGANETVVASNHHMYMDNLSIPHPAMIHPEAYINDGSVAISPMLSRRKSLVPAGHQASPARGSSPPSLNQHHHSFIEESDSTAAHPL